MENVFLVDYRNGIRQIAYLDRKLTVEEMAELRTPKGTVGTTDPELISQILNLPADHTVARITSVEVTYPRVNWGDSLLKNTGMTESEYNRKVRQEEQDELDRDFGEIRSLFPQQKFFEKEDLPSHLQYRYDLYANTTWKDLERKQILTDMMLTKGIMTFENCPSVLQKHWKSAMRTSWQTCFSERVCPKCKKNLYGGTNFGKFYHTFISEGAFRTLCEKCN